MGLGENNENVGSGSLNEPEAFYNFTVCSPEKPPRPQFIPSTSSASQNSLEKEVENSEVQKHQ